MKEIALPRPSPALESASFRACLATILELPFDAVPDPGEELPGAAVPRWLGGMGLGLVEVANADTFAWPGPWIGIIRTGKLDGLRAVVMYGVPSGIVWDPSEEISAAGYSLEQGFVIGALDIAMPVPHALTAAGKVGVVESMHVASAAGVATSSLESVRALAGRGLEGDRHVTGDGTFSSGVPGSALTLIESEVCESLDPPLTADEHRRNLVTSGVELNGLVGHEFTIGEVRCRGMRLCEPCTVVDGYSARSVLRPLVHRGGLRADIVVGGVIRTGDPLTLV